MSTKYHYSDGVVRWRRLPAGMDPRAYRPPKWWSAFADLVEFHPTTGERFRQSQWWIRETSDEH